MSTSPAIVARDLRHSYGDREVLRGVDLELGHGELVAIVGPNGAGKSTLLRLLLGLIPATRGDIEIDGEPLSSLSRREVARRAAFVPQGFHTEFAFTVRELVAMGRTPHLGRFSPESTADKKAIEQAMEQTHISSMAHRSFTELSGGERQRVLLARAFAQEAGVLVLDEPNANLDLLHAYHLLDITRARVREGGAAVAALHDLALASRYCDRLLVLHEGRIHAAGPAREVLTEELMRDVFGVDARLRHDGEEVLVAVRGPANTAPP